MKAAIFDFIRDHPGCRLQDIVRFCYNGRDAPNENVVRQHVHQINSLLAGSGTSVSGQRRGFTGRGDYYVVKEEAPHDRRKNQGRGSSSPK
jgi:hypothetical protein